MNFVTKLRATLEQRREELAFSLVDRPAPDYASYMKIVGQAQELKSLEEMFLNPILKGQDE